MNRKSADADADAFLLSKHQAPSLEACGDTDNSLREPRTPPTPPQRGHVLPLPEAAPVTAASPVRVRRAPAAARKMRTSGNHDGSSEGAARGGGRGLLTPVHFSAQLERFAWDRGCT